MLDGRPVYEHTQIGWALLLGVALLIPIAIVVPHLIGVATLPYVSAGTRGAGLLVGVLMLLFGTLTVRLDHQRLTWHFGIGLVRFGVPIEQIASVERGSTSLAAGFGIHRTREGWLHNVSGREVVAITRKDGRRTLLGSDEPARLLAALQKAIAQPPR